MQKQSAVETRSPTKRPRPEGEKNFQNKENADVLAPNIFRARSRRHPRSIAAEASSRCFRVGVLWCLPFHLLVPLQLLQRRLVGHHRVPHQYLTVEVAGGCGLVEGHTCVLLNTCEESRQTKRIAWDSMRGDNWTSCSGQPGMSQKTTRT